MARPRKFKTVEEMQKVIDKYFKSQDRKKRPYTIQGLALALDFCTRKSFLDYEGYMDENDKKFLNTIKKAKLKVENNKIEGMICGDYSATGVIFDLKNNHGHKNEESVNFNVNEKEMSDEELDAKIAAYEKRNNKV